MKKFVICLLAFLICLHTLRHLAASPIFKGIPDFRQTRIAMLRAHGMEQSDIEKVMEDNRNELNLQLPAYCQITKVKIHFEEFEKTAKKSIKRFMYQEVKG